VPPDNDSCAESPLLPESSCNAFEFLEELRRFVVEFYLCKLLESVFVEQNPNQLIRFSVPFLIVEVENDPFLVLYFSLYLKVHESLENVSDFI